MKTVSALAGFVVGAILLLVPAAASPPFTASPAPLGAHAGAWTWPLDPEPALLRAFDPPAQRWLSGHRGIDLAADPGNQVSAPSGGIVSFV
ncbi:MAG: M23 family peptidase, partial [Micrococcaceae bacterium]|nr:M23 family peptidase [Micrococcaceae bacterium]